MALDVLSGSVVPLSVDFGFIFNFDVDVVAVTGERLEKLVVLLPVLLVYVAEVTEDEVARAGEEEGLRGELVLLGVRYSHGDIVVGSVTAHTSPEHKLFEVGISRLIQEGLQTHVEAQSGSKVGYMIRYGTYLSSMLKH